MSRADYTAAASAHVPKIGSATARAETEARRSGRLDPLVDPAGYGLIRRSLIRFNPRPDKLWEVAVGFPVPIEDHLDTTGSMGDNVDRALKILPDTADMVHSVLPGCDPQHAIGIFGDTEDRYFVICRPQFEMIADRIVKQLTLMVPERGGCGNGKEDPQYGLFAAAYLTASYANLIGLKGYDFAISDEPICGHVDARQLQRVFGDELYDKLKENGYEISPRKLPDTKEIVSALLKRTHAFFLQVGDSGDTTASWSEVYGRERVIALPSVELLPHVKTVIIGLTEGTLNLASAQKFLRDHEVGLRDAQRIIGSVANIPIGAQAALPNFKKRPKKGDLFKSKTDLWPIDPNEMPDEPEAGKKAKKGSRGKNEWL
jgi:hypothetical protein